MATVVTFETIWKITSNVKFNVLSVGNLFNYQTPVLVLGCEDGCVRIYKVPNASTNSLTLVSMLETKSGPVQALAVKDVTRLNANDLTTVDSRGMVTVFSNEQILCRKAVATRCINGLQIQQDSLGNIAIVTSDVDGHVTAFNPFSDLWRLRTADIKQLKSVIGDSTVNCLHAVCIVDTYGHTSDYIIAADNNCHLIFIQNGIVVKVINTPQPVVAMCDGKFIEQNKIHVDTPGTVNGNSPTTEPTQVALATKSGSIYIMYNYQLHKEEYSSTLLPLTKIVTLPGCDGQQLDYILGVGFFDAVCVICQGKNIYKHKTPSWVNSVSTVNFDSTGLPHIIVGCRDGSLQGLAVKVT